jgi:hypothetical protein
VKKRHITSVQQSIREIESSETPLFVIVSGMIDLDEKNGKEGNELNELKSHKFLEKNSVMRSRCHVSQRSESMCFFG